MKVYPKNTKIHFVEVDGLVAEAWRTGDEMPVWVKRFDSQVRLEEAVKGFFNQAVVSGVGSDGQSHIYYPEMNEMRPRQAQIDAELAHGGKHYFLKVNPSIELKGRGIEYVKTYKSTDLTPQAQWRVGWHIYKVTKAAYTTIMGRYNVAMEMLLD